MSMYSIPYFIFIKEIRYPINKHLLSSLFKLFIKNDDFKDIKLVASIVCVKHWPVIMIIIFIITLSCFTKTWPWPTDLTLYEENFPKSFYFHFLN